MTPSCSGSSAPSGATGWNEGDVVTWIVLGVVAALAFFAIALYNRLIGLRNQTLNGWRQIDVQLKRRHDLIPNLVNTVRGAMEFERDTLTQVMEARARAVSATGPADSARKEGELSQALGRLFAVAENYPTLRANDNVKMLQEELTSTENKVGFARQFYNDIATRFNTAQQTFPSNMFASMLGFTPAELFEITDAAERQVPAVDLSMRK
jgi:LemA protein